MRTTPEKFLALLEERATAHGLELVVDAHGPSRGLFSIARLDTFLPLIVGYYDIGGGSATVAAGRPDRVGRLEGGRYEQEEAGGVADTADGIGQLLDQFVNRVDTVLPQLLGPNV